MGIKLPVTGTAYSYGYVIFDADDKDVGLADVVSALNQQDDPREWPWSLHIRAKTKEDYYVKLRALIPADLFELTKVNQTCQTCGGELVELLCNTAEYQHRHEKFESDDDVRELLWQAAARIEELAGALRRIADDNSYEPCTPIAKAALGEKEAQDGRDH
ncbi:MAG: hypothetical protein ACYTEQ_21710 [Planctomycetota bacterium]